MWGQPNIRYAGFICPRGHSGSNRVGARACPTQLSVPLELVKFRQRYVAEILVSILFDLVIGIQHAYISWQVEGASILSSDFRI